MGKIWELANYNPFVVHLMSTKKIDRFYVMKFFLDGELDFSNGN